jgi:hypothetical protein
MKEAQKLLAIMGAYALIFAGLIGGLGLPASAGKRKVIRLEAIKVEGRIQKPQAFYILQRSNLNFESLELKKSFIPKIIESVEKEPF